MPILAIGAPVLVIASADANKPDIISKCLADNLMQFEEFCAAARLRPIRTYGNGQQDPTAASRRQRSPDFKVCKNSTRPLSWSAMWRTSQYLK